MMKNYTLCFIITLCLMVANDIVQAQQDPQYSQYMFNKLVYNPAYAGSEDAVSSTLLLRNQWIDFDGHPLTQTFSSHMPINPISSGVGLYLVNDGLGAERSTNIMLSYAYILKLKFGSISMGASGGFMKKSLDGEKLRSPQGSYESPNTFDHNDNHIPVSLVSNLAPDLALGVYFKNNKIEGGFSVTHIIAPKLTYDFNNKTTEITQVRNYYVMAGYHWNISSNVDLKPSLKIKTDETKTQIDINSTIVYRQNIWAGLSYRGVTQDNNDAVIAVAGLNLTSNLVFGYSYDITTSALRGAGSGSHEFMLNYKFTWVKPAKPEKIIYCPRFL